jgi:MraZ protein
LGISGTKWDAGGEFRRPGIKDMVEQMFLGRYSHTLDNKGRLTIPVRYREVLEQGAYITKGFENNLTVMTPAAFTHISRQVSEKSYTDPVARLLKRYIFSNGEFVELDKAGRILIPQFLREAALLDSEVILVGVGDFFEIWSPGNWHEQDDQLADTQANVGRFLAYDISTS